MGLQLSDWQDLSESEKIKVVNFLKNNCKIDREIPERNENKPNSYVIKGGITSGGYPKKYGVQYRIYIHDITNIPSFLSKELKEVGVKNRIGGTPAIKEIMNYGGFGIGIN